MVTASQSFMISVDSLQIGSVSTEVGVKTDDFVEMSKDLEMITDLLGGTKAMRLAGSKYLPMWEAESQCDYESRLARSFLFDGLRKNQRMIVAKPFSRPVKFKNY